MTKLCEILVTYASYVDPEIILKQTCANRNQGVHMRGGLFGTYRRIRGVVLPCVVHRLCRELWLLLLYL